MQRNTKSFYKQPDPATAEECLTSHCAQIEQRVNFRRSAAKEARARHVAEMNDLRDRVGASFEEQAARRAWNRQVATDQLAQTSEKNTAALLDYKESHTAIEYWPYEAVQPVFVMPDPKVYGEELLAAADQHRKAKALLKARSKGGGTSLRLRREREKEQQASESAPHLLPDQVRAAVKAAADRKREVVGEQYRRRAQEAAASAEASLNASPRSALSIGPNTTYFTGEEVLAQMGHMQLEEAQREIRQHANKVQLRQVLAAQAAEKRMRELREHASMYGEAPPRVFASREVVGPSEAEKRRTAGAARRAELEEAIAQKQRERHELRKAARAAQRQLDDKAAQEEVLSHNIDGLRRREQQAEMALELTKQEARRRRAVAAADAADKAADAKAAAEFSAA